jgi:hypothetical protein
MSTMSFGRIGLAAAYGGDDYAMAAPLSWDSSGSTLTLSGLQTAPTTDAGWYDIVQWRDAMLGYDPTLNGGDEPVIPLTLPNLEDDNLDGFYRVRSVSVGLPPGSLGTWEAPGYLAIPWSATLERVGHFKSSNNESLMVYGLRANLHGITTSDRLVAVPSGSLWSMARTGTRSTADPGTSLAYELVSTGASGTFSHRYQAGEFGHYVGAARIEAQGYEWRPMPGRRSFSNAGFVRLSNGLVRVKAGPVGGSGYGLAVEWWSGSGWLAPVTFEVMQTTNGLGGASAMEKMWTCSVIRNAPEECTLRFPLVFGGLGAMGTLDVSTRRGSRWLDVHAQSESSVTWRLRAATGTAAASTAITGGVRRTSDLAGSRWILTGPRATTNDTTNGAVTTAAAATSATFGIGCEIGGSGASGQDTAANQIEEFYHLVHETVRVQDF